MRTIFPLLTGISIIGIWVILVSTGQVPELITNPLAINFHLAAEFLTASFLIVGSLLTLQKHPNGKPVTLFSLGMLTYTTLVSAGYYLDKSNWPAAVIFLLIFCTSIIALSKHFPLPK